MTTLMPLITHHSLLGSTTRLPFTINPSVMRILQVGNMISHRSCVTNAQCITNAERLARTASVKIPPPGEIFYCEEEEAYIFRLKV